MGAMLTLLLAFVAMSAVVICTPGPDTALTVRNAITAGRRGGVVTAAGVASGQLVWTVTASAGIAGLLQASEPAFLAVKLAGALYLIYLGAHSLWTAWRGHPPAAERGAGARAGHGRAFRQGLVSNLANPKMAAFFLSMLPQFAGTFAGLLAFGALFCLLTFLWLAGYSVAVHAARRVLDRPRVRRTVDAVSGAALVAFGARLALTR
ncbi:LysE family translocator [Pseudonocardia sp. TRM90224]|uniref:LysE family translocator n=1 Tax=Pseudonocardia sp. TRM90224 TaxID=2812678 RepID=UPI001E537E00|nr:LysE family translocator [Pseudonocardia sp. TRM90224]